MNTTPPTSGAVLTPAAVAPALLERHKAALRSYVQALTKGDAAKVEAVVEAVWKEAQSAGNAEFEDDPTVWLFANARRRIVGGGQRDAFAAEAGNAPTEDEAGTEGEEPRVVVHRTIEGLTAKQQEALRLKFQFNLNLEEIANVTGQAKSGIGGLLHHAMVRIGKALGAREDDTSHLANDPRVTAYALDEMDASERSYFEKGIANGKALLEREKAIRAWGGHITEVLSSGAPVPKRRRKKRGAVGWKSKALWVVLGLAAAAAAFWVIRRQGAAHAEPDDRSPVSVQAAAPAGNRPETGTRDRAAVATPNAEIPKGKTPGDRKQPGVAGARQSVDPSPPVDRAELKSNQGEDPRDEFFRRKAEGATPVFDSNYQPNGEKPATTLQSGSASGRTEAKKSVSVPSGPGGGEAAKEIDWVKDRPGPRKAAEKVDALPAMGGLQRQLLARLWPQRGQVRIDEMLKNTPIGPRPVAKNPIEAHLEVVRSPWDPRKQLVRVSVRAKDSPPPARGPANLVFAIDVSKSMAGANRLPLVREGIRRLVDRLRPDDILSVVTYAAKANVALDALPAVRSAELRACLGRLEAAGLTNGSAGLRLAYETARNHWIEGGLNVVVLCTDGNFNLGTTDEAALGALAATEAKTGVRLSVFGFGRTDRNDLRLEVLATNGGGRSCYVNTEEDAEGQLVAQIEGLFAPVAKDVRLQVEFSLAQVEDYRRNGDESVQETAAAAAKLLPGRSVTALFEITPRSAASGLGGLGRLRLGYTVPETGAREQQVVPLAGTEQPWARTGVELRFAVAMAEFGRILRNAQPTETAELDRLEAWVRENLADDAGGYRTELLQNLELARAVVQGRPAASEAK